MTMHLAEVPRLLSLQEIIDVAPERLRATGAKGFKLPKIHIEARRNQYGISVALR